MSSGPLLLNVAWNCHQQLISPGCATEPQLFPTWFPLGVFSVWRLLLGADVSVHYSSHFLMAFHTYLNCRPCYQALSGVFTVQLLFVIFHIALVWWFPTSPANIIRSCCCGSITSCCTHWYQSLLQFPSGFHRAGACFFFSFFLSWLACRARCNSTFHTWDSVLEFCHCDNHWFSLWPVAVWALRPTNDEALAFREASYSQMLF